MLAKLGAAAAAGLSAGLLALAHPALADTTIIGGGFAAACSDAAKAVSAHHTPMNDAMHACDLAIGNEDLSRHDLAATYVNRGVLFLAVQNYSSAKTDFDQASQIQPDLGEAWVNRGAAEIGLGDNRGGISDIDKGLMLDAEEPEKAYFNRAIAKERLDDLAGAYADYQKALELKPDWPVAKAELARFHVVQH